MGVQQVSEVCASRIPTRLEEDVDSRTSERVAALNEMVKVLGSEMDEARLSLSPTRNGRDKVAQEARSVELFLQSLEGQILNLQPTATTMEEDKVLIAAKWSILDEMREDHQVKLVNSKRDAERREEELQHLEVTITNK